jgi:repressor LexA
MPTITLTARQKEVLDFIRQNLEKRGYPPSLREISGHFRMTGTRAVEKHIAALERKGYLQKGTGPRALAMTERLHAGARGRAVPVLGRIAAGRPVLAEENLMGNFILDSTFARWKESFLLKVKGESMKDAGILEGDHVLVKPQPDADSGEIVVALVDGEATVKRLLKKGRTVVLQPENPRCDPIVATGKEEFKIIGKVVGVLRF